MERKIRALSSSENLSHHWEDFNHLFQEVPDLIDEVFNIGGNPDLTTYVPQLNNFETKFLHQQLNPCRKSDFHKMHILKGKYGRGKSTFVHYLHKVLIPKEYGNQVLSIFINGQRRDRLNAENKFRQALIKATQKELVKKIFTTDGKFRNEFLKSEGYIADDAIEELTLFKNLISVETLLRFINNSVRTNSIPISGILVTIDNIDENPKDVVIACEGFLTRLINIAQDELTEIPITTLVTARHYNANYVFLTNRLKSTELPATNGEEMIKRKIISLKDKVRINPKFPRWEKNIEFTLNDYHSNSKVRRVIVEPNKIADFLSNFCDQLFDASDVRTRNFLQRLSAGNLKVLSGIVYNILHSNKLPLTALFQKYFMPDSAKEYPRLDEPFKFQRVLECLLSVSFPFYTVDQSLILNLFNCGGSDRLHNYQDVLIMPRILAFLYNCGKHTLFDLYQFFEAYDYDKKLVNMAIDKFFQFGLLYTPYGVKRSQMDIEKTKIALSEVGKLYLDTILNQIIYLQYVAEDTYLPAWYVVPINQKYSDGKRNKGSKDSRLKSAEYLVEHIAELEQIEIDNIARKQLSIDRYLELASIQKSSQGSKLSDYLQESIKAQKEYLE